MSSGGLSSVRRPAVSKLNFSQHSKWAIPLLLLAAGWWAVTLVTTCTPSLATARPSARNPSQVARSYAVDRGAAVEVASAPTPILDGEDEETSATILSRLVAQMDVIELRGHLRDLALEDLRGEAGQLLVRRWSQLDPESAVRWAAEMNDAAARQILCSAAALAWAERDMTSALAWAQSLPRGETSDRLLNALGLEIARTDPVLSLELAAKLPEGDTRNALELHAARQWAGLDPRAAKDWAAALPPGNRREQVLAAVTLAIAGADGEGAARFLVESMSPGPESYRAVIGVVQRWAQTDYPGALKWVERFPPTPLRETALAVLSELRPVREK